MQLRNLNKPIYAFDFSSLLNDRADNYYLVQSLAKNINGNCKIVYEFIENFKLNYEKQRNFIMNIFYID